MTKKFNYTPKETGDTLSASEWNNLAQDVDAAVDAINNGTGNVTISGTDNNSHFYINDKGNLCIETTAENTPSGKKGKINIESNDDIQLKPGDDITFYSDHRGVDKTDEVSVKIMDGSGADDVPVKLQLNAAEITLTTKDKTGNDAAVMDINVNSAKNTKGYLKVRAQAIDLRCEDHGGIALQPKGTDGDGHMNKIKFEHGGGDGLEFGTFNAEKTSIYTNEYRFKGNGVWKAVSRRKDVSDKYDNSDETTHYKYQKQEDDFYDVINDNTPSATTYDIINGANDIKHFIGKVSTYPMAGSNTMIKDWYNITYNIAWVPSTDAEYSAIQSNNNIQKVTVASATASDIEGFANLDTFTDFTANNPTKKYTQAQLESAVGTAVATAIINNQATKETYEYPVAYRMIDDSGYIVVSSNNRYNGIFDGTDVTSFSDIATLVNYYKTNNLGPWANA